MANQLSSIESLLKLNGIEWEVCGLQLLFHLIILGAINDHIDTCMATIGLHSYKDEDGAFICITTLRLLSR